MASLRVEVREQSMAELWASFRGQRCSVERARAHRSELATAPPVRPSFLRERGERERVDVSRHSRAMPWRSCTPSALTSGVRDGVQMPNVAEMLQPVGHVDGYDVHSDGVVNIHGVLIEFYKFFN